MSDDDAYEIAIDAWKRYSKQDYSPDGLHFAALAVRDSARQQWISVEDELPEPETDVLIRGHLHCGRQYDIAGVFHGKWMSHVTQDDCKFKVTHWMPLPKEGV
ncbi:DUF551 domain-containing protein [Cupriavidus campinensis]